MFYGYTEISLYVRVKFCPFGKGQVTFSDGSTYLQVQHEYRLHRVHLYRNAKKCTKKICQILELCRLMQRC